MDCQMPVMDGLEATRQLRRLPTHAACKIVAMTANVMAGEEQRCLDAGMDDYIAKPIDIQVFYATLLRHLRPELQLPCPTAATIHSRTRPAAPCWIAIPPCCAWAATPCTPLAESLPGT
jgi:DNA-binding response OmpR family regulator